MRNYITGTTRGLGRAIKDRFEIEHIFDETIGLDRPQHDLFKSINSYVKDDFDIYVINAHHEWSQTELLYELFKVNQQRKCQIVVIGSVSADGDRKEINPYAIQKKALDAACTQLQLVKSECFITQIKLGRMNTDLVALIDAAKMDVVDVASMIYRVVAMNSKNSYAKTITIDIKE